MCLWFFLLKWYLTKANSKGFYNHVKKDYKKFPILKYEKNQPIPCPKCGYETAETKGLSMSTRSHKFGRQQPGGVAGEDDDSSSYYAWQSKFRLCT